MHFINFCVLLIFCARPFVQLSAAAPSLQIRAEAASPGTAEALNFQEQKQLGDATARLPEVTESKQPLEKAVSPGVLAASDSDPTDLPTTSGTTTAIRPEPTFDDAATTTTTADPASITPAPANTTSDTVTLVPPVTVVTQLGNYSAIVVACEGKTTTIKLSQPSTTAAAGPSKTVGVASSSAAVQMSSSVLLVAASLVSIWALI